MIDPQRVEEVYVGSLAEDLDPKSEHYVVVDGVIGQTAFDKRRLALHADDVKGWLEQLPMAYRPPNIGGGGGWSFLNACDLADGTQWTGLHLRMDQLFQLGIGLDMAAWLMPRELWPSMPGGMPYVAVIMPEDRS